MRESLRVGDLAWVVHKSSTTLAVFSGEVDEVYNDTKEFKIALREAFSLPSGFLTLGNIFDYTNVYQFKDHHGVVAAVFG